MKKVALLLMLSMLTLSCSEDEENEKQKDMNLDLVLKELPQKWKLVKTTGSFAGSENTGDDMQWQETYTFNNDDTFTKTRLQKSGDKITASGTFVIGEESETSEKSLKLTFNESSAIIGSCHNEPVEYLYYKKDSDLLLSNWWACDGPGLFYKKVKN